MNILKKVLELLVTIICFAFVLPGLLFKFIGFIFDHIGFLFTESTKYVFTGLDCVFNFDCNPDRFEKF